MRVSEFHKKKEKGSKLVKQRRASSSMKKHIPPRLETLLSAFHADSATVWPADFPTTDHKGLWVAAGRE